MSAASLWEAVKPYKELLAFAGTLATIGAIALNYFATATALERVECQLANKIVAADANAMIAKHEREISDIDDRIKEEKSLRHTLAASAAIDAYERRLAQHEKDRKVADANLAAKASEKAAAEKILRDSECAKQSRKEKP
jgi:hypothetical protein